MPALMNPTRLGTKAFQTLDQRKRDRILSAALEEFAANGYRHASMNAIVKKAGISKGSLFWYFRSKGLLFSAIVDAAVEEVKKSLRLVRFHTANMDFSCRLEMFIRAGVQFIDAHPLLARIYFHLLQSGEAPFGAERVAELRKLSVTFFSDLIREGIGRGELRSDLPVLHAAFLMNCMLEGLLRAYHTQFLAEGLNIYKADDDAIEQWIRSASDLLHRGMASAREAQGNLVKNLAEVKTISERGEQS